MPVPVRQTYDYLTGGPVTTGTRVLVPFGRRTMVGIVVSNLDATTGFRLKPVKRVLDTRPALGQTMLKLLQWASRYYHHPIGEVLNTALPARLRTANQSENPDEETVYRAAPGLEPAVIEKSLGRAPRQKLLYDLIASYGWCSPGQIKAHDSGVANVRGILAALMNKGLLECRQRPAKTPDTEHTPLEASLTREQQQAIDSITACLGRFSTFVLHGITGSGKTEVYLHIAQSCIRLGKQALVLVPEIALTPQLVARFAQRFAAGVCMIHSNMTAQQRYLSWCNARSGRASVVLGTRSAIFTPLKNPGVIIVDEEHDISYKQQDGFRYHARGLAIKRASLSAVPVVLGSATPSMESMRNVDAGRYQLLRLSRRIGSARLPEVMLVDTKIFPLYQGLSAPLLEAIRYGLERQQQTILYINRRGFAPIVQCGNCRWRAGCDRCDAFLTYHQHTNTYRCHHCGKIIRAQTDCPECHQTIFYAGTGTQRIEKVLTQQFPKARISRFDRDRITTQKKLVQALHDINRGSVDIVIGTQLIAKGHDFPGVTLVGVIDPDRGLYSADFRAPEYLFQQLVQVAGRAGRSENPGRVMIQTAHPENPCLHLIQNQNFDRFYQYCARERETAGLPPFGYLLLWRAESTSATAGLKFLQFVSRIGRNLVKSNQLTDIAVMDPVSSPMEKLAGRYRAQLLVTAAHRKALHTLVSCWLEVVEKSPESRQVRWSIDIDPMEMF